MSFPVAPLSRSAATACSWWESIVFYRVDDELRRVIVVGFFYKSRDYERLLPKDEE